jgi:hypothetical protein
MAKSYRASQNFEGPPLRNLTNPLHFFRETHLQLKAAVQAPIVVAIGKRNFAAAIARAILDRLALIRLVSSFTADATAPVCYSMGFDVTNGTGGMEIVDYAWRNHVRQTLTAPAVSPLSQGT